MSKRRRAPMYQPKRPYRGSHRLEAGRPKPALIGEDGRFWAPPEWLADVEAEAGDDREEE